jgi:hypothetical protein
MKKAMKIANTAAVLLALSLSGGGAWAQAVNSEKGPVSHPQVVADPVQGSEKGPVSHPQSAADPVQGSEKRPDTHPQATKGSPSSPTQALKHNSLTHEAGEGK